MVYLQYQTNQTLSLANLPQRMTPPGNRFMAPLHGIMFKHVLIYSKSMLSSSLPTLRFPWSLWHSNKTPSAMFQLSKKNAVVVIGSFALIPIFDLVLLIVSVSIWLSLSNYISLLLHAFIFDSSHTILFPLWSRFRESHIYQSVLVKIQRQNYEIFQNSENSNCFW